MRINRVLLAVLLIAVMATPLVVNPQLFSACPNQTPRKILCPGLQSACKPGTDPNQAGNCLSLNETVPQSDNFDPSLPNNGTMAQQQITKVTCNQVFGCRWSPALGCLIDPNNQLPDQTMLPYKQVNCAGS